MNKRNSQIMSEDFDIFSLSTADQSLSRSDDNLSVGGKISLRPPPQAQTQQKRFSTHLQPSDALPMRNIRYRRRM